MPTDPTFECINIPKRIYHGISDTRNLGLLWGFLVGGPSDPIFSPLSQLFGPFGPQELDMRMTMTMTRTMGNSTMVMVTATMLTSNHGNLNLISSPSPWCG